ncbi:MAG: alpha/beta fold hydrolase BchO [Pseudomonadota bacterium]
MGGLSRFVLCKPHMWHIQETGTGPLLLLIHGAGGATQSWRHLFPLLSKHYRVVAVDLPGQGFTKLGAQQRCSLSAMAEDIAALCKAESWDPHCIIGHSAGAAIALQLAHRHLQPELKVIGINAALSNFGGLARVMFPVIAKALTMVPMVADVFNASSTRGNTVERLIKGTGSTLTHADIRFYQRLLASRRHVNATLQMMSQWQLDELLEALPDIHNDMLLITGDRDKTVPPSVSDQAAKELPNGQVLHLSALGHLAHEEDAEQVSGVIQSFLEK